MMRVTNNNLTSTWAIADMRNTGKSGIAIIITIVPAIILYNAIGNVLEELFRTGFVFSEVICITTRANKHIETETHNSHFSEKALLDSGYPAQHVQYLILKHSL
jgi:hypothetical protein